MLLKENKYSAEKNNMAAPMWKGAIEECVHGNSESASSVLARGLLFTKLEMLDIREITF